MMYGKFLIPLAFNQSQFRQLSGKFPDYGRSVSIMRRFAVIERPVFSADIVQRNFIYNTYILGSC